MVEGGMAVLMVKMWEEGVFPKIRKRGVVKLPKKSEEKPAEDIKSYRPVTLLPVLGKFSERVIAGWLLAEIEERLNVRQYGFRKGLGTKDALEKLSRCVSESESKYVYGVFADIKGAFDNAWHVAIVSQLVRWGCSKEIVRLIESYLSGREVKLKVGGAEMGRGVTKGCPQGTGIYPGTHSVERGVQ